MNHEIYLGSDMVEKVNEHFELEGDDRLNEAEIREAAEDRDRDQCSWCCALFEPEPIYDGQMSDLWKGGLHVRRAEPQHLRIALLRDLPMTVTTLLDHVCEVCFRVHVPEPCCPGCPCRTGDEASRLLAVLRSTGEFPMDEIGEVFCGRFRHCECCSGYVWSLTAMSPTPGELYDPVNFHEPGCCGSYGDLDEDYALGRVIESREDFVEAALALTAGWGRS